MKQTTELIERTTFFNTRGKEISLQETLRLLFNQDETIIAHTKEDGVVSISLIKRDVSCNVCSVTFD